ncbi:hypothetical protein M7I_6326 [Glarea lozoyensis 74030]|uniref:Uncharacterized protein n=1 Tax=Glarea lozoyensis (strain ATCC 74030 / MF5533) TaxID=1104152 RepID=H0EU94_GLAL7|nr:hypothetical protein M7I_6326 [Glarea lozoyensis 74030]
MDSKDIPSAPAAAQIAVVVLPIAIPASLAPAAVAVVDYTSVVAVEAVVAVPFAVLVSVAVVPSAAAVDK